ncbi:hypothetical protein [Actinomadura sp. GC306]|uniref:hypothetical protein n=1 Tax=Actinomadura sp. GC306 TaxID=2530367 RepID=UPI001A9FCB3C|nr:hypothetical protein [Actinomadura sp. GC306]
MSTAIWVVIAVVVVAALVAVVFVARSRAQTQRLKRRFGPEYDRAVRSAGSRSAAERELRSREQRHEELQLQELDPARREQYREQWVGVQERFVDTPEAAVEQANGLVTVVMGERGYPTHGFEEKVAHLSVEHGRTMDRYRRAHAISGRAANGEASTEDLRQAMQHYRELFEELLSVPAGERHADADRAPGTDHDARTGHDTRTDPAHTGTGTGTGTGHTNTGHTSTGHPNGPATGAAPVAGEAGHAAAAGPAGRRDDQAPRS